MPFADADLALLQSLLADLRADSGTLHAIGADGALHLRCAIGIPEPVLAIVAVVPVGKGMAGLAAERRCAVNSCNIQQDTTGDVRPGARATGLAGSVATPTTSARSRHGARPSSAGDAVPSSHASSAFDVADGNRTSNPAPR